MAKNTSVLIGDYFEKFISEQIQTGRYSSASEVVRAALRFFEEEESRKNELLRQLKLGEESGYVADFDRDTFMKDLHDKHSKGEL